MRYTPKHRALKKNSTAARTLGLAVVGGATVVSGLAFAPSASAAGGGNVWDRVAACESGGDWNVATGNGYYGGLQFSASSWRSAGGGKYASLPHHATRGQQIAAAQVLLRQQGPGAWPVCGPRAGLTRSNGGASLAVQSTAGRKAASASTASGRMSVMELQRKVGARVDGIVGPETVRKTERALGLKLTGRSYFNGSTLAKAKAL